MHIYIYICICLWPCWWRLLWLEEFWAFCSCGGFACNIYPKIENKLPGSRCTCIYPVYIYIYTSSAKKYYICTYIHTCPQLSFFSNKSIFSLKLFCQCLDRFPLIPRRKSLKWTTMITWNNSLTTPVIWKILSALKSSPNAPIRNRSPPQKNSLSPGFFLRLATTPEIIGSLWGRFSSPPFPRIFFSTDAKVRSHASKSCP